MLVMIMLVLVLLLLFSVSTDPFRRKITPGILRK